MPRFHCKHCGIVSDDAEIVPLPEKDAEFRRLLKAHESAEEPIGRFTELNFLWRENVLAGKYNHSTTCPVCLGETRFWRESPLPLAPLPTDGRINLDNSPFSLSVKAMLSDMNL